jgi:hypothetical protein
MSWRVVTNVSVPAFRKNALIDAIVERLIGISSRIHTYVYSRSHSSAHHSFEVDLNKVFRRLAPKRSLGKQFEKMPRVAKKFSQISQVEEQRKLAKSLKWRNKEN